MNAQEGSSTCRVADGVEEEEVVAGSDVVAVGIEGKIEGAGCVAERGCHVLSVHLHEAVAELVVIFLQQLLASFPKVVISGDSKLQRFLCTRCEHGVHERRLGTVSIVQVVTQKSAKIRRRRDSVQKPSDARAASAGMKRTIDKAGVAHEQTSDASALLGQAQREVAKRRRDQRVAGGNAVEHSGSQCEVGPSVLKGCGIFKKLVGLDGFGVFIDARYTDRAIAPAAVAFGEAEVELWGRDQCDAARKGGKK